MMTNLNFNSTAPNENLTQLHYSSLNNMNRFSSPKNPSEVMSPFADKTVARVKINLQDMDTS